MLTRYLYHPIAQWITLALLLITGLLFWQFALRDEKSIQADSARRIDDEQLALRRVEMQVAEMDTVVARYRNNSEEIAYFQEHYLRQKAARIRRISAFLETIARKRGVQLEEIRYEATPARGESLETYSMELPLTGRYRDIRLLIGDIEASDMYLVISKLSLEDVSGRQGAVRVQLVLSTFFEGRGA